MYILIFENKVRNLTNFQNDCINEYFITISIKNIQSKFLYSQCDVLILKTNDYERCKPFI
jgi:hypothetical protein